MSAIIATAKRIMEAHSKIECNTHVFVEGALYEIDHLTVADDHEKECWFVALNVIRLVADDDRPRCHEVIERTLTALLGEPSGRHERSDLPDRQVNNWDVDGVLVVQLDDSIDLFEPYRKVPRR